MSDLGKRLRERLGGVEAAPFCGDNLAIFLASEFEPGIESEEMDESGTWKQGAIDAADQVLDAIHGHYHAALDAKDREIAELTRERDHWKANHAQMVQRNAVLRERPDLPADRLPSIARYEATLSSLTSKLEEAGQSNANLLSIIADIREASGLGAKPMLGEMAGAIRAQREEAEKAQVITLDHEAHTALSSLRST